MKRFTPPRDADGQEAEVSEDDYSDSDSYTDSYTDSYSDSDSYTESVSDSEGDSEIEDETLAAIRNTERAKKLRAKFEEWEQTQDAREQMRQMDELENGDRAENANASNLKAKFEALGIANEGDGDEQKAKFRPKRFK